MDTAQFEPVLRMLGALVLALPVAWDRERHGRIMGLRTFPLVSLGACAYILIGQTFIVDDTPGAMARIIQGLMTGIGFVGGGAILKRKDSVLGTASAASIWITGAIGAAAGLGIWTIAVALSVLNFAIILGMSTLKPVVADNDACED